MRPRDKNGHKHGSKPGDRNDPSDPTVIISDVRPIDGTNTNPDQPDWGSTSQTLLRLADANYADGIGDMANSLPNPREISNTVSQQTAEMPNSFGLSDMFWAWGQFIDHDLDLTEAGETDYVPIEVPAGDPYFDPTGSGEAVIPFTRVDPADGSGEADPRAYHNEITSFLDASMVYGSDSETAASLRDDNGKLLLSDENLVIETGEGSVLAGDVRAGENVALTSLHTLFAREHNRLVDELAQIDPDLGSEELFQAARQRVEAQIQAITFNEFLPALLGEDAIPRYNGYDPDVNPGIAVEFSTAAFRFGHSLISSEVQRLNEDGTVIDAGNLALAEAFFSPEEIAANGGIEPILRGIADGTAQELDTMVVEDIRSFLFGQPGSGGLDLASINIQRGRDMGVASYNDLREAVGLERAESFSDITSDPSIALRLEELYGSVDLVDAWIGGLAEDPHGNGVIGETFGTIILDQFLRIRDGDPYWSQNSDLPRDEIRELWDTTLADVIEANSDIEFIQDNVLFAHDRTAGSQTADELGGTDYRDLLLGMAGDDLLDGGDGDDQLEGGDGLDQLFGGLGNDIINGGAGDDLLTGGDGDDTFVFEGVIGDDVIADFQSGRRENDVLSIESELFTSSRQLHRAATQDGDDVYIDLGDQGSITLLDTNISTVFNDDIFVV